MHRVFLFLALLLLAVVAVYFFVVFCTLRPRTNNLNTWFVLQVKESRQKPETKDCVWKHFAVCSCMLFFFYWFTQYSWLGVKYQLTDSCFQNGNSSNRVPASATIVSTVPPAILTPRYVWLKTVSGACSRYPGCCRSHSSVSARLCLAHFLHRSLCICLHVRICSGILSSCCNASRLYLFISFPNAQWSTADAEVQVPCAENPALLKMHSFKSDSATVEVVMCCLLILVFWSFRFIEPHFLDPIPNWI